MFGDSRNESVRGEEEMIFQAHLYYFRKEMGEFHFDIIFDSNNESSSVSDIYRWIQNRKRCLPDVYGDLRRVKVSNYLIGKIEKDGFLAIGTQRTFYEWKADFPYPFDGVEHGR